MRFSDITRGFFLKLFVLAVWKVEKAEDVKGQFWLWSLLMNVMLKEMLLKCSIL